LEDRLNSRVDKGESRDTRLKKIEISHKDSPQPPADKRPHKKHNKFMEENLKKL
jgi:hypothetical protein